MDFDIEILLDEMENRDLTKEEYAWLMVYAKWLYEYHGHSENDLIQMNHKKLVQITYKAMSDYSK